jgi:hypothetical protein
MGKSAAHRRDGGQATPPDVKAVLLSGRAGVACSTWSVARAMSATR